jgi:hypothetical protein
MHYRLGISEVKHVAASLPDNELLAPVRRGAVYTSQRKLNSCLNGSRTADVIPLASVSTLLAFLLI